MQDATHFTAWLTIRRELAVKASLLPQTTTGPLCSTKPPLGSCTAHQRGSCSRHLREVALPAQHLQTMCCYPEPAAQRRLQQQQHESQLRPHMHKKGLCHCLLTPYRGNWHLQPNQVATTAAPACRHWIGYAAPLPSSFLGKMAAASQRGHNQLPLLLVADHIAHPLWDRHHHHHLHNHHGLQLNAWA